MLVGAPPPAAPSCDFSGLSTFNWILSTASLAEEILKGSLHEGEPVNVTVEDSKIVFSQSTPASGALSS